MMISAQRHHNSLATKNRKDRLYHFDPNSVGTLQGLLPIGNLVPKCVNAVVPARSGSPGCPQ